MKKMPTIKSHKAQEMAPEYRFDYRKAKSNRFAARMKNEPLIVMIEPDIAKVFTSSEQVNKALRALISAIPEKKAAAGK
jgi:hypothetical protein